MTLLKITINDDGEHWDKKISVFGIVVYHRHDFTKESEKRSRTVGFNVMPSDPVEIEGGNIQTDRSQQRKESKRKSRKQ